MRQHPGLMPCAGGCARAQVSLAPSALAPDGSGVAATVTVPGGNKAKVKEGEAVFKNVRIEAEAPGHYVLRAKSASRKACARFKTADTNRTKIYRVKDQSLYVCFPMSCMPTALTFRHVPLHA
jgi:hypothetical protein